MKGSNIKKQVAAIKAYTKKDYNRDMSVPKDLKENIAKARGSKMTNKFI